MSAIALLIGIGILIPSIAIITIFVDMFRTFLYWRDATNIIRGLRKAMSSFREKGSLGILVFDLSIEELSSSVPQLRSPISKSLIYSIQDAKNVICNEISLSKVKDLQLLKTIIADEILELADILSTKDLVRALEEVGNVYLAAVSHRKRMQNYREFLSSSRDFQIADMLLDFSDTIYAGRERALSEELGDYIGSLSKEDLDGLSPILALIIFWLRRELINISKLGEEWKTDIKNLRLARDFFSTNDELFSLSLASIALAVLENDRMVIANEIAYYNPSKKIPEFLVRLRRNSYRRRAFSLGASLNP